MCLRHTPLCKAVVATMRTSFQSLPLTQFPDLMNPQILQCHMMAGESHHSYNDLDSISYRRKRTSHIQIHHLSSYIKRTSHISG
mmetsp:Transcript_1723/g.2512  ORF Transcript_1723/g.2512 Transcript_1723/m.2512 type:complete len:84 (+) Transcript_1723:85-336(+)